jgi:diguanylate cyclase (GGDEF)-like protein/PAS domain S-box-containing protein
MSRPDPGSTRASRAGSLGASAALVLLAMMAVLGLSLVGSHRDARRDLEDRFGERAAASAALLHALLDSTAKHTSGQLTVRYPDGRVGSRDLEGEVRRSQAVYELVAGADGRVLASTDRAPAAAAARAGEAMQRLGFPGAPAYLLWSTSDEGGRALVEMAIPFRAGKSLRVHLAAVPARLWTAFFDPTLKGALRERGARSLVLDDRGRVLGDSAGARHPGAPYGSAIMREAGGKAPFSAASRIGRSPLRVVYVTSRDSLYAPIGGRRAWAVWLAFALAVLAMGAGLWLAVRLKLSHVALRRSEERYALAVRAANDGIWDWDLEVARVHYSERWAEMLGLAEPLGDGPEDWLDRVHPEDRAGLEAAIDAHLAGETPHLDHEHRLEQADGEWMWALVRGLAVHGPDGRATRMAGSLSDITGRRHALAHLEHQANHDPLTGLANRAYFFSVLERSLERTRRGDQPSCAVVFLDLDGFKLVNDRYGHVFGDAVLATVGHRLQHSVRPGDVVGRLGGDELAVLLTSVADAEEAEMVASRLSEALAVPYSVLGETVAIGASAGTAIAGPDDTAEELLREADAAMYRAKLSV